MQIPMINGMEEDALPKWHRHFNWRAGLRKLIKRQYNKRCRRKAKEEINDRVS